MDRSSFPHFLAITMRWKDNDVYGHVNNVEYYSFFDTVINGLLIRTAGSTSTRGEVIGLCAESHCTFTRRSRSRRRSTPGLRVGAAWAARACATRSACSAQGSDEPAADGLVRARVRRPRGPPPGRRSRTASARRSKAMHADEGARRRTAGDGPARARTPSRGRCEIEEVELTPPGPGELLVRVRAAGLCHSDLSVIDGSRPRVMPMVLGHEAAGEVVEVGEAPRVRAGRPRGRFAFVPACGDCGPARDGRAALCEPGAAANTAGTLLGGVAAGSATTALHHHLGVSAFADQSVVSARSAVKIDPTLPPRDRGAVRLRGDDRRRRGGQHRAGPGRPERGRSSASAASGWRRCSARSLAGAHPIVAVDVVPAKLELARALGATHAIDARGTTRSSRSARPPAAAPTTPSRRSAARRCSAQAYAATRRGGTTVTVGLPHPSQMSASPRSAWSPRSARCSGSYLGSCVPGARHPALHRALPGGPAAGRPAAHPPSASTSSTRASTGWPPVRRSVRCCCSDGSRRP